MIRMRLVASLIYCLVLVSILHYIIIEFNISRFEPRNRIQHIMLEARTSHKSSTSSFRSENITRNSNDKKEAKHELEPAPEPELELNPKPKPEPTPELEPAPEPEDHNHSQSQSSKIFKSFNNLPSIVKVFQNHQKGDFSIPCQNYWKESVKSLISKYKHSDNTKSPKLGPNLQTEEIIKYLSGTTINDDNTMIKIRLKYIFDSKTRKIIQFKPILSCIVDHRIPKPKPNRLKIRDINHTIKYIFKAIKEINKENQYENINTDLSQNHTRYLDVLIHYDDCPIIWNSMPFHIYKNDTLHLEKCILNSKFSKQIQFLISNSTEIYYLIHQETSSTKYNPSSYSNNSNHSFNNKYSKVFNKSSKNLPSYVLYFNPSLNQNNNYYNKYSFNNSKTNTQNQDQDGYNNYYSRLNNNNAIISNLIHHHLSNHTICNEINHFVNQIISNYSFPGIICNGNIQCYIPCFFENNNLIFSSIFHKLKKRDTFKLFNHLHCICKFNHQKTSSGLILSISSHFNSLDFASIPYVNHLDNNEITARSIIHNYYYYLNNTNLWNLKNNTLFFIGRYTDTFRLDLSCDIYNLLIHNNQSDNISNKVFISDSNKISCENRARLLEKLTLCDSLFICRKESISFNHWISESISSKFSLDVSGVGPWSNRLRMLMLTGKFLIPLKINQNYILFLFIYFIIFF